MRILSSYTFSLAVEYCQFNVGYMEHCEKLNFSLSKEGRSSKIYLDVKSLGGGECEFASGVKVHK